MRALLVSIALLAGCQGCANHRIVMADRALDDAARLSESALQDASDRWDDYAKAEMRRCKLMSKERHEYQRCIDPVLASTMHMVFSLEKLAAAQAAIIELDRAMLDLEILITRTKPGKADDRVEPEAED